MNDKTIEATVNSPMVKMSQDGKMIILGRSIMVDPHLFYSKISELLRESTFGTFSLDIQLEYMNSTSVKVLFNFIKSVNENYNSSNFKVNWYYTEGDDSMLDLGKDFASMINVPFELHEMNEEAELNL